MSNNDKITYRKVIAEEDKRLKKRRELLMGKDFADALDDNRFGIALSGGGIRSATINLGILKTLHKFHILKQADYLSTVSGGGYTGAYIQTTLRQEKQEVKGEGSDKEVGEDENNKEENTSKLFHSSHIDYMRKNGEYMFPGKGWSKLWNQITLVVAFIISFLMSLVSPAIIVVLAIGFYFFLSRFGLLNTAQLSTEFISHWKYVWPFVLFGGGAVFALHYVFNTVRVFKLEISTWFNRLETFLIIILALTFIWPFIRLFQSITLPDLEQFLYLLGGGFLLLLLGLLTNPNGTSFHRYYRKQLANAFLNNAGEDRNIEIHKLFDVDSDNPSDYTAPYPLINTCLNLQASKDPDFLGVKASDYFLLSPLYCGSKLVGYVPTAESTGYKQMTLPAAATISAAAVNPGMGAYSNKLLSILLTIFNLRLGFWAWNPKQMKARRQIVWWPLYFFYELLGKIGTDKKMVNISDGGHIENLGVMELLRRKCKLIIAVDAGADPDFSFADLENLTVRARNELGIDIKFRTGDIPEKVMRVSPSHGYSKKRLAIAETRLLWERKKGKIVHYPGGKKIGILVYAKSAVTAPKRMANLSIEEDELKFKSYHYKLYNPDFPHQSTADQFFDPVQWEAYFQLGQFIGSDILGCDDLNKFEEDKAHMIPLDELYRRFDEDVQLFGATPLPLPSSRVLEQTEERSLGEPKEESLEQAEEKGVEMPQEKSMDEVVMEVVIDEVEAPTGYEM